MTSSYFCKLYITCLSPVLHINNQNAIWKVLLESNFQNEHSLNGKLTTQQTSSLVLCPEKLKSNAGKSARTLCCCMLKKSKINKYNTVCVFCHCKLWIWNQSSYLTNENKWQLLAGWLVKLVSKIHLFNTIHHHHIIHSPQALKPPFQYINHCNLG